MEERREERGERNGNKCEMTDIDKYSMTYYLYKIIYITNLKRWILLHIVVETFNEEKSLQQRNNFKKCQLEYSNPKLTKNKIL